MKTAMLLLGMSPYWLHQALQTQMELIQVSNIMDLQTPLRTQIIVVIKPAKGMDNVQIT